MSRPKKICHCVDCGKLLTTRAQRCKICIGKFRSGMQRRVNSPELKAKKREIAKRMWNDPIIRQRMLGGMRRAGKFGYLGSAVSKLETKVADCLRESGLNIDTQYRPESLIISYDIIISDLKLLIEVDGDYWHHSDWAIADGRELNDDIKNVWALANGYNLIRYRECDLNELGMHIHVENGLRLLSSCDAAYPVFIRYCGTKWLCSPANDVIEAYNCAFVTLSDMNS